MRSLKTYLILSLCSCIAIGPATLVHAAPQGGRVVAGSATIKQSGAVTHINQSSDRAVINWKSFDIGKSEAVHHLMPTSQSSALHRVTGGKASQIEGLLQSNGNIYLVNPAGVMIHKGARVKTNSFTVTSRDIADDRFMKNELIFDKPGRPDAEIVNSGNITVGDSGLAALVAPTVRNNGIIAGKLARVALASGDAVHTLDLHGDELITFTLDSNDVNGLHTVDGSPLAAPETVNSGSILTDGGVVVLTAAQLDGIVGSVVNSGNVEAGSVRFTARGSKVDVNHSGRVDVSSAKGSGGQVFMDTDAALNASGTITATGADKGGSVSLTGHHVALNDGTDINASGTNGGGTVLVGGNWQGKGSERTAETTFMAENASIHADALSTGNGGTVVLWSDKKTVFEGQISAKGGALSGNGGKVETSAKLLTLGNNARVTTAACNGKFGEWLLDPENWTIANSGGDQTPAQVEAGLANSHVTIQADNTINVNANISWSNDNSLTFHTPLTNVNADITASGYSAGLIFTNDMELAYGKKITLSGTHSTLSINGDTYNIIHDIHELQNINNDYSNMSGKYALGIDINAYDTASWTEGFKPIGSDTGRFSGVFNGLGNTISGLTIRSHSEQIDAGLFHEITSSGSVLNVNLKDANVFDSLGYGPAGIIAATSSGTIKNVHTNGSVNAESTAGGLVGQNGGKIFLSSSSADVTSSKTGSTGGLIGLNSGYVYTSFSSGNVSGSNAGGFIGQNFEGYIENSYTTSNVTRNGSGYVGGFIATSGGVSNYDTIINCFSAGKLEYSDYTGGFIGNTTSTQGTYINNSYWDIEATGIQIGIANSASLLDSSSLKGLSTSNMLHSTSYQGWQFNNSIWGIEEGISYPYLVHNPFVYRPSLPSPTPPSYDYFPSPDDSDCSCDCGSSSASAALSASKGSMDEEFSSSDSGLLSDKDLWLSQNVSVHNDQMSYLHDDTVIDLLGTTETVEQAVAAMQTVFGDDAEVMNAVQEALKAADEGDTESVFRILASVADGSKHEAAVRMVLSRYFTGKAAEQMLLARKDLGKASQGGGASMNSVMEALVGARMYAIAAEATAGSNAGSRQELAELPPTVDSLYWSGTVQRGFGRSAMQGIKQGAVQQPSGIAANADPKVRAAQEQVLRSLNQKLGGILSALNKSSDLMLDAEAGDFMGRTSLTVVEALKNDEMLQRYIDLYTYYVNEKMSFASVLMG